MTPKSRQVIVLAVLVAVLLAVSWWQLSGDGRATSAAAATGRLPAAATSASGIGDVPVVEMARLEGPASEPIDTGRDPFRFGAGRRSDAGGGDGPARPPSGFGGAARPVTPAPVPTGPPVPPPPPPIPLRFIGLVQEHGGTVMIAVLSDSRGVYHGREGDVIEGRYRIFRIGHDAVEMMYLDGRGRQLIRLSGS